MGILDAIKNKLKPQLSNNNDKDPDRFNKSFRNIFNSAIGYRESQAGPIFTKDNLKAIYRCTQSYIDLYYDYLYKYMIKYNIDNANRICAFLAQIGHESGRLRYSEEIASGAAYEGRIDLGNTQPGDGVRFKGRGLIQITGRTNYDIASKALDEDFISNPKLLSTPEYAAHSACWWWSQRKYKGVYLNDLADMNTDESFKSITKGINGGLNGYTDRINLWNSAKKIIKV